MREGGKKGRAILTGKTIFLKGEKVAKKLRKGGSGRAGSRSEREESRIGKRKRKAAGPCAAKGSAFTCVEKGGGDGIKKGEEKGGGRSSPKLISSGKGEGTGSH